MLSNTLHCRYLSLGALLKACFCLLDIVTLPSNETLSEQLHRKYQAGFELHTWSTAPQGSGLGTSSILAGVILSALLRVTDRTTSMESLIHAVLIIEQMLTTGGGWQDNVGGLVPGFKIGRSQASLPLKVEWEKLELSEKTVEDMIKRLVCFYSGRTRLAKNLLQVKEMGHAKLTKLVASVKMSCFESMASSVFKLCYLANDLLYSLEGH